MVIPACIYLACRIESVPRTMLEISMVSGMNKSDIGNLSFEVAQRLNLQLRPVLPEQYVRGICTKILIPIEYDDVAVNICRNIHKTGVLRSMAANTVAATVALAISLGSRSTERLHLLEEISFSAVNKIRKCYAVLYVFMRTVLPPKLPKSFAFGRLPGVLDNNVNISARKKLCLTHSQNSSSNKSSARTRETIDEFESNVRMHKNRKRKQPCVWELSSLYYFPVMKESFPSICTSVPMKSVAIINEKNVDNDFKRITGLDKNVGTFSTECTNGGWSSLQKKL